VNFEGASFSAVLRSLRLPAIDSGGANATAITRAAVEVAFHERVFSTHLLHIGTPAFSQWE